jgi:glycerol uptake facilitator-like aquaporin
MNKAIAEFLGTFTLVLVGCGAAVISGMGSGATSIDAFGIGAAFGLALVAMAYGIGQISGCHINPAVSVGVWAAGRMTTADLITYAIAQILGAIAGAVVLYLILSGKASGWTAGSLGQNGWGSGYLGEYNTTSAFLYETIATFLFLVCILGVTQRGAPVGIARPRHRARADRYAPVRHQHHGHVAEPGTLDRAGAGGRGRECASGRAALAVHPRAGDWCRHRGLSVQVWHSVRR